MVKKMGHIICRYYPDEHYVTIFNAGTGFFARVEEPGHPEPFCSEHGPELIDISITGWCSRNCPTCYRSSTTRGHHMSLTDYEMVIQQAARLGVCQVALGGGNPNQHPDFLRILELTREEYGIVPNYTTNGTGLTEEILQATAAFCGALAVSAYEPYAEFAAVLGRLISCGIKVNVHFVLDSASIDVALAWLLNPPAYLSGVNAIIFLNYKPIGRGSDITRLLKRNMKCREFLETALGRRSQFKLGFDSCMASGLASCGIADPVWYDACEAARFSMYISETMRAYPCSFMEGAYQGVGLNEDNLLEIWQEALLFRQVRNRLRRPACQECFYVAVCRGGCPVFPEINLCDQGCHSEMGTDFARVDEHCV